GAAGAPPGAAVGSPGSRPASTCGPHRSACPSRAGGRPRSAPSSVATPRASGSVTSRRARSSVRATTPSAPPPLPPGSDVYAARMARAQARMRELGVDVLLLSTGADLPYLTGYEAMPLERLTMLVLPADGDAALVIPRLEAPRVVERPEAFELFPWDETDDPIEVVAGLVDAVGDAATSAAIGDHTWARFVLDLQRALPDVAFRRAVDVTGPLRVV